MAEAFTLAKEYGCHNCDALCCKKGVRMPLSPAEAAFMTRGGTELQELTPPVEASQRKLWLLPLITVNTKASGGLHELQTDCGYLKPDPETGQEICSAYEDPNRPAICGDFKPGEYNCMLMRLSGGVDGQAEFDLYNARTAGG